MANLYTKTGDKGQTSLVGGTRVSKDSPRVECYGTIDEANSMLGLAYAQTDREYIRTTLRKIQGRLFSLGAELASDEEGMARLQGTISEEDVAFLEEVVDTCTETTGKQTHFVIPGVDPCSAALHVARTIVRRAERHIVTMSQRYSVRPVVARYVNRLSDAIYALARLQEDLVKEDQLREKVTCLVREKLDQQQTGQMPPFSLANLQRMAGRAEEKARQLGVPVVFAAVDQGGNLMLLQRMDGALLASVEIASGKAYTASALKMATHELGQAAGPDGPLYSIEAVLPGKIVLFGGGFPYVVDGEVVGGIGVSGGTVEQDMEIARWAMSL
ncbi:MAG: cob(I)yrinic acid a,c-diamide adenosyltransferase [Clostridiales bacterium]|uniref:cob(I)yrinic acid a,c-diamide adenosyltransferase n=1 Tax=Flavonifractor porci TaxID=3133422 RepID=UPI0030AA0D6A|nr:cob(I)yrinic acid a,c-diamide adenosyltransferase [Clostridiales bacterium]